MWLFENREQRFWNVVKRQAAKWDRGEIYEPEFHHKAANALRRYDSRLVVEIRRARPPAPELPRQFIITAHGVRDAFDAAQRLVDAAPALPGWKMFWLRPAIGCEIVISIDDFEVRPENVWFRDFPEGRLIGLEMFLRDLHQGIEESYFRDAARNLLQFALGEYIFATRIGTLRCAALPTDLEGLKPFREIVRTLAL